MDWVGETDRFWYRRDLPDGKEFLLVDPVRDALGPAFDHERLAAGLGRALGRALQGSKLPFDRFVFAAQSDAIEFEADSTHWRCHLSTYACSAAGGEADRRQEGRSADGKWVAFVKDYNLYVRSTETGQEIQLTNDGERDAAYATPLPSPTLMIRQNTEEPEQPPAVFMPEDSVLPTAEPVLFEVETDLAPVSVLRRSSDGSVVRELERADLERLLATGWKWPEPFRARARDGKTDIYGIIWRPSTFDPSKRYPVVERIYTGPHGFHVPKSFPAHRSAAQSIAEPGFIVVQVDGLGTAKRSREFHDFSYKNLGDGGVPDHIAALRHLAEKYPNMDLSRVGIYGHSAGGYDATHALLTHPEFYKVRVSGAGNHNHRMDKAWWNTQWMGYPLGDHYGQQSNVTLAHQTRTAASATTRTSYASAGTSSSSTSWGSSRQRSTGSADRRRVEDPERPGGFTTV